MDAVAEANALAAKGDPAGALPLYEEAVRKNPGDERGHCGAVLALLRMKQGGKAAEWAEKLIGLRPGAAYPRGVMGTAMEMSGRPGEALACYAGMLRISPGDVPALFRTGKLLIESGRAEDGLGCFKRALEAEPSDEAAAGLQRQMRASVDRVLGAGGGAKAPPGRRRGADGADMPGMARLAEILFGPGGPRGGGAPEAVERAGRLADMGKLDEALGAIDGAIAGRPDLADAHSLKASILVRMGRYREADERMGEVLRLRPGGAEDLCTKGMLLEKLGRATEAIACYERAIEAEPGETMARYLKCGALAHAGDALGLAECYREALSSEPRDEKRGAMLGSMRAEYGELERCAKEAGSVETGLAAFVDGGGVAAEPHWGRAGRGRRARGAGRAGRLRAGRRR